MNATPTNTDRSPNAEAKVLSFASRRTYRERGFGTGYGRSSGYAMDKRYTSDWGQIRFRCG